MFRNTLLILSYLFFFIISCNKDDDNDDKKKVKKETNQQTKINNLDINNADINNISDEKQIEDGPYVTDSNFIIKSEVEKSNKKIIVTIKIVNNSEKKYELNNFYFLYKKLNIFKIKPNNIFNIENIYIQKENLEEQDITDHKDNEQYFFETKNSSLILNENESIKLKVIFSLNLIKSKCDNIDFILKTKNGNKYQKIISFMKFDKRFNYKEKKVNQKSIIKEQQFEKIDKKKVFEKINKVDLEYRINQIKDKIQWDYIIDLKDLDKIKNYNQPVIIAFKEAHIIFINKEGKLEETSNREDWFITPKKYGIWDYKEFGKEFKKGNEQIGHKRSGGQGILSYAIKGLLKAAGIDPNSKEKRSNLVILVSIGRDEALGIHNNAKDYLSELKKKGKITNYEILNSKDIPAKQFEYLENGYETLILMHTTC